jgi:cytidylate kinase
MTEKSVPVITVDGPSGSGKGTLGQWLAQHLGWHFLDSGAVYRVLALAASRNEVPLDDAVALVSLAHELPLAFEPGDGSDTTVVLLDGEDVGAELRTEACGNAASRVAAIPEVRDALLDRQRGFREAPGLVADGRDMGTVVFPDANLKLFLDASAEMRAQRRYKQLKEKGIDAKLPRLIEEIAERDRRDRNRSVSPLRPADDAMVIDASDMNIDEVRTAVADKLDSFAWW